MKKILSAILLITIIFSIAALPVHAQGEEPAVVRLEDGTTVIHTDDGHTVTISPAYILETQETGISPLAVETKTVTSGKDAMCTDSDGNLEWKYTLTATFQYTVGIAATCLRTSYTQTIYENHWTFSDGAATKTANKANGTGTYVKRVLLVITKTVYVDISLTCDAYGNVT